MLELKILPYPLEEIKVTDTKITDFTYNDLLLEEAKSLGSADFSGLQLLLKQSPNLFFSYPFIQAPNDYNFLNPLEESIGKIKEANTSHKHSYLDPPWKQGTKLSPTPSSLGKMKKLLFVLPKDAQVKIKFNFFPVLKEIIKKISHVEDFIIIHRGYELDLDKDFKKWLQKQGVELLLIKNDEGDPASDSELSIWAQDHFYPLKVLADDISLPQVYGMVGNIDSNFLFALNRVAKTMASSSKQPHFKLEETGLPFEGGNILVGEDFMLVGANDYYKHSDEDKNIYEEWFGKKTIFVKTYVIPPKKKYHKSSDDFYNTFPILTSLDYQPLFHLDLFLTLVGYNFNKTSYTIIVGHPELGVENIAKIDHEFYLFLNKWLTQMQASIASCVENLKTSFQNLLKVELQVISIPLVLTYNDKITSSKKEREWFWATYNNCLVEHIPASGSKKVWLPSYGHPRTSNYSHKAIEGEIAMHIHEHFSTESTIHYGDWSFLEKYDNTSKNIWEALGFEVCLLEENYLPFARQHGSLNCFANCLDRESTK